MKLYFNGCSHTFGDDLGDPANSSWPALIAAKLGCDFVNDSISGGTNDRIRYRTIKSIDSFDKFYIAWTYTCRFTRYRADNNHEVNFNPGLSHCLYGSDKEFRLYGGLHYKTWHNELFAFKIWLQDIILLQNLFESKNKPYVMITADHNHILKWTTSWQYFNDSVKSLLCFELLDDTQLKEEHLEIQNLCKQINFKKFIGWGTWWLSKTAEHHPVGPTNHLLESGHVAIADYILLHEHNVS